MDHRCPGCKHRWASRVLKPKSCPKCKVYLRMVRPKAIVIDMRKLKDDLFDKISAANGKKQDQVIQDTAALLALYELSGGKATEQGKGFTEEEIKPRFEDLCYQILCEFMVREGSIEAEYDTNGRIVSMKSTEKGLAEGAAIIKRLV